MSTWADFAVPLQQFDGQLVVYRGFRWPFTLMRAAIEGASQSLWLMQSGPVSAALARFVRMIRHDLSEQRRAWKVLGRDSAKLDRRMERHEAAANVLAEHGPATAKLPAMVDLVRIAAAEAGRDADVFEAHWRVCSAAAHGKDWAVLELQSQVGERFEWRPGQFHFEGVPNVDKMTKILEDTMTLVSVAVIRFLQRSGVENIDRVLREAALTAARATPQQDGGAHVENLARVFDMA
ncbi:MAG: hypothetical protein LBB54_06705 [Cellulomonadaceae bacterium]|nr:hypothetical protein [Cellulomonadaceae bacterium]